MTTFNSFESLDFWLFFIVGALVCSVAFGAIATRGFKTVKPSFIRGSAAIAVMLVAAILVSHGAKTSADFVPKEEDIARIELNDYDGIVFEDNLSVITRMHAQIVENINNDYHDEASKEPEIIGNLDRFTVKYILKNGRAVERSYFYHYICRDNLYDDMLEIMKTEEFMSKYYEAAKSEKGYVTLTSYEYKNYGGQSLAIINTAVAKEFVEIYQKEMAAADLGIFGEECLCLYINGDIPNWTSVGTSAPTVYIENAESIGSEAFKENTYVADIYIPNTVTYIGENAFDVRHDNLTIHYDGTKSEWDDISKLDSSVPDYVKVIFKGPNYNIKVKIDNNLRNVTNIFYKQNGMLKSIKNFIHK